jgi:hypothetical protein
LGVARGGHAPHQPRDLRFVVAPTAFPRNDRQRGLRDLLLPDFSIEFLCHCEYTFTM